jgi:hypothetical protein
MVDRKQLPAGGVVRRAAAWARRCPIDSQSGPCIGPRLDLVGAIRGPRGYQGMRHEWRNHAWRHRRTRRRVAGRSTSGLDTKPAPRNLKLRRERKLTTGRTLILRTSSVLVYGFVFILIVVTLIGVADILQAIISGLRKNRDILLASALTVALVPSAAILFWVGKAVVTEFYPPVARVCRYLRTHAQI